MTEEEKLAEQALRDAGISTPDSTPMGIVDMEGRFFREISSEHRSPWVRGASMFVGFLFLFTGLLIVIPIVYFCAKTLLSGSIALNELLTQGFFSVVFIFFWGTLFTGCGVVTIKRNLHSKK